MSKAPESVRKWFLKEVEQVGKIGLSIDKPTSINYDDERFLKDWGKTLQMNGKENKR